MPANVLNPVTPVFPDASGNDQVVQATNPLPVTDVGEAAATTAAVDPNALAALSNQALLRGIFNSLILLNTGMMERLDGMTKEMRAMTIILAETLDYAGGPESARADAQPAGDPTPVSD